mmetsp:Transcript_30352/g.55753  ORF Transcript_30352/g.55753 Transcript_30352/m.55753 type:complete len:379 (+) Transcript_30352:242-1378(+)
MKTFYPPSYSPWPHSWHPVGFKTIASLVIILFILISGTFSSRIWITIVVAIIILLQLLTLLISILVSCIPHLAFLRFWPSANHHPRIHNHHRVQQQTSPFPIHGNLIQLLQNLHPTHQLPKARIRLLVQIMMTLPARPVIFRIIDFVNVKIRSSRPSRESHRVRIVGIIHMVLLKRHLIQLRILEPVHQCGNVGVVLPRLTLVVPMRSSLEDVHGVDDKGATVPQLVVDLLEEEVDGYGHEVQGSHFEREGAADARPGGGREVYSVLGIFDVEFNLMDSITEPLLRLPLTRLPKLLHQNINLAPKRILPPLHIILVIIQTFHLFNLPPLHQRMSRSTRHDPTLSLLVRANKLFPEFLGSEFFLRETVCEGGHLGTVGV